MYHVCVGYIGYIIYKYIYIYIYIYILIYILYIYIYIIYLIYNIQYYIHVLYQRHATIFVQVQSSCISVVQGCACIEREQFVVVVCIMYSTYGTSYSVVLLYLCICNTFYSIHNTLFVVQYYCTVYTFIQYCIYTYLHVCMYMYSWIAYPYPEHGN